MFALSFHACVGRSGSIEGLLVQDTETGIKQKDKKSPDPTGMKNIKANRLITGSIQVDPSRQDRKIVDSGVKNQAMQVKTSKRTNQMLLLCPVRLNSH